MSTFSISAVQNTQIIMLCVNSIGTTSACDLASIFACPQCGMHHLVYMRYLWAGHITPATTICDSNIPTFPNSIQHILAHYYRDTHNFNNPQPSRHMLSIYVQYWQSDSDGQIYFPMVQMDPSDKRIFGRRSIFPMENK